MLFLLIGNLTFLFALSFYLYNKFITTKLNRVQRELIRTKLQLKKLGEICEKITALESRLQEQNSKIANLQMRIK